MAEQTIEEKIDYIVDACAAQLEKQDIIIEQQQEIIEKLVNLNFGGDDFSTLN